jgi:hypothetical protein
LTKFNFKIYGDEFSHIPKGKHCCSQARPNQKTCETGASAASSKLTSKTRNNITP